MLSRAGREKRTEARVDHEELHGGANGGPDRRDLQVPAREPHARTLWMRPSVRESFLLDNCKLHNAARIEGQSHGWNG